MNHDGRHIRLLIGLGVAALVLLGKIFSLQILDDRYKEDADRNSTIYETIYPTRGVIYDRNGNILVGNKVAYDILVSPREVQAFDTLALATVLDVDPVFIREKLKEADKALRPLPDRIGIEMVRRFMFRKKKK